MFPRAELWAHLPRGWLSIALQHTHPDLRTDSLIYHWIWNFEPVFGNQGHLTASETLFCLSWEDCRNIEKQTLSGTSRWIVDCLCLEKIRRVRHLHVCNRLALPLCNKTALCHDYHLDNKMDTSKLRFCVQSNLRNTLNSVFCMGLFSPARG